jgi:DNA-binding PadR family transcriptional regulator
MSTTAAFGSAGWLGRLMQDLTCGHTVAMAPHGPSGGKAWGPPPWFGAWAKSWGSSGDWRGRGDWWSGGSGRPRAGRGDVRSAILALLREGPRHGYQIIQDIAERSGGAWRVSPGSVYPALAALQDEGLIDDEKIEGRRVYALTDAGRAHVDARRDELAAVFAAFEGAGEDSADEDYGRLLFSVGAAAVEVARSGTSEQMADARRLLAQARRDLYGLLAESDDVSTDAEDEQ